MGEKWLFAGCACGVVWGEVVYLKGVVAYALCPSGRVPGGS